MLKLFPIIRGVKDFLLSFKPYKAVTLSSIVNFNLSAYLCQLLSFVWHLVW